jgi:hypothetical protein
MKVIVTSPSGLNLDRSEEQNRDVEVVRFEVFTAVTMKNAVVWDVAPCRSCVS